MKNFDLNSFIGGMGVGVYDLAEMT